jgi:hypothetical protein
MAGLGVVIVHQSASSAPALMRRRYPGFRRGWFASGELSGSLGGTQRRVL